MARPFVSPSVDTALIVVALILAVVAIAGLLPAMTALAIAIILICVAMLT